MLKTSTNENFNIESINPTIIPKMLTEARQKTWQAIKDINALIIPGMSEKTAIKKANEYFAANGVKKFWHKTHVRFGTSTVMSFDDPYHDEVILKDEDIYYIDVGPVWDDVEADCGATFVVGNNPEHIKIKNAVKELFLETQNHWKTYSCTGVKLNEYAMTQAEKMGYKLFPSYVKGHRLSEFSHSKYTKMGMFDLDFTPAPERWILEIQLCHPSMQFGAFYEDIL